jgi:hypothetical protein
VGKSRAGAECEERTHSPIQEPDSQCHKICSGNSSEFCSASSRLTLYVLNNTTNTATTATITTTFSILTSTTANATVTTTTSTSPTSLTASYTNATTTISTPTTNTTTTTSTTPTSLTTSYTNTTIITSTTSSSTASSGSSTASSTSPTSPWSYVGCANDTSAHRAFGSAFTSSSSSSSMTVEACQSYFLGKNYPFASLEYSTQCCCGLSLGSYSIVVARWPIPATRPRPTAAPHASACTITPITCTPARAGCGYIQSLRLLHRHPGRAWVCRASQQPRRA